MCVCVELCGRMSSGVCVCVRACVCVCVCVCVLYKHTDTCSCVSSATFKSYGAYNIVPFRHNTLGTVNWYLIWPHRTM